MNDFKNGFHSRHRKISNEVYSKERLESIQRIISRLDENNQTKYYQILIDSEVIVHKTNDPNRFFEYLDYIEPNSHVLEVRTFFGSSPNCNSHRFYFKGLPAQNLGGIDVDEKIQVALHQKNLETEIMLLQRDKDLLLEKIESQKKKLKNYKKLQEKLDEKQIDINDLFTKGVQLIGMINSKKTPQVEQVQGLPEMGIEQVKEESETDKHFQELKENYSESEIKNSIQAWEFFAQHPELKNEFESIIKQKLNNEST